MTKLLFFSFDFLQSNRDKPSIMGYFNSTNHIKVKNENPINSTSIPIVQQLSSESLSSSSTQSNQTSQSSSSSLIPVQSSTYSSKNVLSNLTQQRHNQTLAAAAVVVAAATVAAVSVSNRSRPASLSTISEESSHSNSTSSLNRHTDYLMTEGHDTTEDGLGKSNKSIPPSYLIKSSNFISYPFPTSCSSSSSNLIKNSADLNKFIRTKLSTTVLADQLMALSKPVLTSSLSIRSNHNHNHTNSHLQTVIECSVMDKTKPIKSTIRQEMPPSYSSLIRHDDDNNNNKQSIV